MCMIAFKGSRGSKARPLLGMHALALARLASLSLSTVPISGQWACGPDTAHELASSGGAGAGWICCGLSSDTERLKADHTPGVVHVSVLCSFLC